MNGETTKASVRLRPRVLCVDDEPMLLQGLMTLLGRHFDVTGVTSGSGALRVLTDEGPYAVVISDYAMPGMNGAEFLAQAYAASPDTARILLTGHASLDRVIAVVNQGSVFRILTKPCEPSELMRSVEDALEYTDRTTNERALAQHKLESMASHLVRAERLASLGTMAGAIGHEINNVLTPLLDAMATIDDCQAQGRLPQREDIRALQVGVEHLIVHARNLLQLGRPPRPASRAETDLRASVGDVLGMLRAGGLLRNAQIRIDVPDDPVWVGVDKTPVDQVIVNLVKNALEAFAGEPAPRIEISIARQPPFAECSISDNASGIAEAALPMLFEPYYTTKPPERGTGLGLFVVRRIAQDAGGDVAVRSEVGRGTTFVVRLPLSTTIQPSRTLDFQPLAS